MYIPGISHILSLLFSRQHKIQAFEYDPVKSAKNLAKHGIDFEEAQALWNGRTVAVPLGDEYGEERIAIMGLIGDKHWTAIVTMRGQRIRIISVRRSRKKEEAHYDSETAN